MASHVLIDMHLVALGRRLPADAVDELADGLTESYEHHLHDGLGVDHAAELAVAEFGTVDEITTAFVRHAPGRRVAVTLLATGPGVAACWAVTLVTAQAWTWPLAAGIALLFGIILLATIAALVAVAANTTSYARTRLTAISGTTMILLDTAMIVTIAVGPSAFVWPMALAIPASLTRIGLTARALPRILTA